MDAFKKAIVVGATGGVGKETVKKLKQKNWEVLELSRANGFNLQNPKIELEDNYDALINCAGILHRDHGLSGEQLDEMIAVNFRGPITFTEHILKNICKNGAIVHVTSCLALYPIEGMRMYSTTKAELNNTIKYWMEKHPSHRFYGVCPGLINTPMGGGKGMKPSKVAGKIMECIEDREGVGGLVEVYGLNEAYGLSKYFW